MVWRAECDFKLDISLDGLMDALIFVDTNILLDFYPVRSGGGGLELLDLIEAHKEILITGSQVEMEYKKNRQQVILEALKAQKIPDWSGLSSPAFLAKAKPAKVIAKSKKTITAQQAKLKKRIASILDKPNFSDPVFKTLSRVFHHDSDYNLSRDKKIRFSVRRLARKRFVLGYPPRKQNDTSIGDAINWEWVVGCAKSSGKNIIIVSRDSDYGGNYDGQFHLNDWLRLEFKERVSRKRRIVLTDRLAEAFQLVAVSVSTEAEEEEKTIVAERLRLVLEGIRVPGRPHLVESPYSPGKYVDVEGFRPGTEVKVPYTDKIFLVP